jgi:tyrosine-protein phosphatase 2/3
LSKLTSTHSGLRVCHWSSHSRHMPRGVTNGLSIVVAGCRRIGTFCAVDSVIEMLKGQRTFRRSQAHEDAIDLDSGDDWLRRDDVDLVARTVEDFRRQRLSLVQNLRQFVLCYETVLQWFVDEQQSRS